MKYKQQISPTSKKKTPTTKTTHDMCNVNNLRASCSLQLLTTLFLIVLACSLPSVSSTEPLKVIYAVNAGGDRHTDQNGIHYTADTLKVGIASDYGKHLLMIGRVQEQDELLYRTERYHTTTFGYDFPADGDGDYALIMKFCEVYFDAPNRKVFDVLLNRKHTVVKQLDIYDRVGRGSAHDEIVYFKISNGRLHYESGGEIETSDVRNGQLRLDFIKGALDNPKINAFALLKGDVSQLPRLHSTTDASERRADIEEEERPRAKDSQLHQERIVRYNERQAQQRGYDDDADDAEDDDDYDVEEQQPQQRQQQQQQHQHQQQPQQQQQQNQQQQQHQSTQSSKRIRSGPRQPNPYSMDDSSVLMPVFVAICAFIPLLFCLCKL